MTPRQAAIEIERLKSILLFLTDTPAIYAAWEFLVTQHSVAGMQPHDARLVAAIKVHGLSASLTFDRIGFSRFEGIELVSQPMFNSSDERLEDFHLPGTSTIRVP